MNQSRIEAEPRMSEETGRTKSEHGFPDPREVRCPLDRMPRVGHHQTAGGRGETDEMLGSPTGYLAVRLRDSPNSPSMPELLRRDCTSMRASSSSHARTSSIGGGGSTRSPRLEAFAFTFSRRSRTSSRPSSSASRSRFPSSRSARDFPRTLSTANNMLSPSPDSLNRLFAEDELWLCELDAESRLCVCDTGSPWSRLPSVKGALTENDMLDLSLGPADVCGRRGVFLRALRSRSFGEYIDLRWSPPFSPDCAGVWGGDGSPWLLFFPASALAPVPGASSPRLRHGLLLLLRSESSFCSAHLSMATLRSASLVGTTVISRGSRSSVSDPPGPETRSFVRT
ncbi:hypothetical protein GSI_13574 [Ganoderma sinense ZZ0214-1]|uniref:Uncharacterized protein n=1 Tax=Ganoderma sinense ZZ0214-1 TaxID=1077348 RepID=A0A2G8RQP1_9APHY|nr:hypothetical protein GSI_13574 [Ganoderma sinense ZZ0214-1]